MPTHNEQQMQSRVTEQIKYYDFHYFFDFRWKNYYQLSTFRLFTLLRGPWRKAVPAQWLDGVKSVSSYWTWHFHGSLIHGKFDLKTIQSLKTPWQECGVVARANWWAPIWTQESPTSMQINRPGERIPEKDCWVVTDVSTSWAEVIFRVFHQDDQIPSRKIMLYLVTQ